MGGALMVVGHRWEEGEASIQGGSFSSEVCHLALVCLNFCMQRLQGLLSTNQKFYFWGMMMKRVSGSVSGKKGKVRRRIPPIHGGMIMPFTT